MSAGPTAAPATGERGARRPAALPLALAAAVALLFLALMLAATGGRFVAQNVDLYLILQYAKAMAEGHPFRYNPGEPPSTGATSLLHTVVLAAAHFVGIRGEGLVAFAIAVGIACYVATVRLAQALATRLRGPREGLLAAVLVALGGPLAWAFLYGSDIALFLLLALWTAERYVAAWSGGARALAWIAPGVLLALARPEGLVIAIVLAAAWWMGPGRTAPLARRLTALAPVLAGLVVLLLYRVVTGRAVASSVADKSLLANFAGADALALVAEYLVDVVRGLLLGFYPSQAPVGSGRGWASLMLPPLLLPLVLLALAAVRGPLAWPVRTWSLAAVLVGLLVAPNVFMGAQFNRYLLWSFPWLLVLGAVGLGVLCRLLAREDEALETALFRWTAGVMIALAALSTLRFAAIYAEMAGGVQRRDLAAARWITSALPPGARIANIATSVEYLTGHRAMNLHGVTTPAFFGNRTAEREAGTFEALSRLPPAERPEYLLTSVAAQEGNGTLRELVQEPPLFQTSSLSDELLVYRFRPDLLGRNAFHLLPETAAAVQGLRLVDRLNVCDTADEAAHGYRFRSRLSDLRLNGTARIDDYFPGTAQAVRVIDSGRAILGRESFRVATEPGRDLVLVMRTAAAATANVLRASGGGPVVLEFTEAGLIAGAGGQQAARVTFRPRPGWDEAVIRIPGALVKGPRTQVELSGRYAAFHYWAYQ